MDAYSVEFDFFRRLAESGIRVDGDIPESFASILCMQNAALFAQEKSRVSISAVGGLGFSGVAKQMGRLSGPRGCADRQDVSVVADADTWSASGKDDAAWVVRGKAKQQSGRKWKGEKRSRMREDKGRGDGQALNGFNRHTGVRNRRYMCDSECHLAATRSFRDVPRSEFVPSTPVDRMARQPSSSAISMGAQVKAQILDELVKDEGGPERWTWAASFRLRKRIASWPLILEPLQTLRATGGRLAATEFRKARI